MDTRALAFLVVGADAGFRQAVSVRLREHGCLRVDAAPLFGGCGETARIDLRDVQVLVLEIPAEPAAATRALRYALDESFRGVLVLALRTDRRLPEVAVRLVRNAGERVCAVLPTPVKHADVDHLLASQLGLGPVAGFLGRTASAARNEQSSTCLVVTPFAYLARLLRSEMGLLGLRCELAENRETAMELWSRGDHRFLLTSCDLGALDGYDLVQAIRRAEAFGPGRLPTVGLARHVDRDRALAVGMDTCLTNPWSRSVLAATVRHVLRSGAATGSAAEASMPRPPRLDAGPEADARRGVPQKLKPIPRP
ncbi:MAG: hypothetical protein V2J02_15185 [Pseudomonadales bacterium]|jgi:CheY-like chemotaxis protein|nr:hypothetical protein [Pseudomonadales bacterium]